MATETLTRLAILASPIAAPNHGDALTSDQWTTLLAITDAFVPAIDSSSTPSTSAYSLASSEYTKLAADLTANSQDADLVRAYLSESSTSTPGFKDLVNRMLGDYSRPDARKSTSMLLSALG